MLACTPELAPMAAPVELDGGYKSTSRYLEWDLEYYGVHACFHLGNGFGPRGCRSRPMPPVRQAAPLKCLVSLRLTLDLIPRPRACSTSKYSRIPIGDKVVAVAPKARLPCRSHLHSACTASLAEHDGAYHLGEKRTDWAAGTVRAPASGSCVRN